MIAGILIGCASPPNRRIYAETKQSQEKSGSDATQSANMRAGEARRMSEGSPKQTLWAIAWKTAEVEYDDKGDFGGGMFDVTGTVFRAGKPMSGFAAKEATATYGSNKLSIRGDVTITVLEPKTTLKCRQIVWNPDEDRYEARGSVIVDTEQYTLGPFDAIYASANLQTIGTPETFIKQP